MTLTLAIAAFAAALVALVLVRAMTGGGSPAKSPPLEGPALERAAGLEAALAALVRRRTVSYFDPAREDGAAFAALVGDLERLFPLVHAKIDRELIGDRAILFQWKGSEHRSLAPAIICAHFDVVPADDAAEWAMPPFCGEIVDGELWGRGSQDIKVVLASALHAAERLLAQGFKPKRTIYFAFGGDEEVGGSRGARLIGEYLASRGVEASFLLDEGGPVSKGMLSFADRPLALVGIAEKGYLDISVETAGAGGHASMPPRRTATGDLARAIAAIEASRPPARIGFTTRGFLAKLAPFCPLSLRVVFRNLWLFSPLVKAAFSASATTNALVRTTFAPTVLEGSPQENVLAGSARAIVNVRILPGDSSEAALSRVARLVAPYGARVRPARPGNVVEPLPESPIAHEGYRAIESALAASFPEAGCVPYLHCACTDTKHYAKVAKAIYRFTPLGQTGADIARIHARDERVSVAELRRCGLFYEALLASL